MKKERTMSILTYYMQLQHMFRYLPENEKRITYATLCTLLRILLTPFIVMAMMYHQWFLACSLFISAALTDAIDGFIARYFNQQTVLGACIDPLADKILLLSCFCTLSFVETPFFVIPHWFFYVLCSKEIVQCVGAVWLFSIKKNIVVEPTVLGKATTVVHVFFIIWLFLCYFFNWMPQKTYNLCLVGSCVLIIATFIDYVRVGIRQYTTP